MISKTKPIRVLGLEDENEENNQLTSKHREGELRVLTNNSDHSNATTERVSDHWPAEWAKKEINETVVYTASSERWADIAAAVPALN